MEVLELAKSIKNDPLRKAFFLSALESYARNVLNDPSDWGNSLVNKATWQDIARHYLTLLEGGQDE